MIWTQNEQDLNGGSSNSSTPILNENTCLCLDLQAAALINLPTRDRMELYASGGNREEYIGFILLYYYYDCVDWVIERENSVYRATALWVSGGVGAGGSAPIAP